MRHIIRLRDWIAAMSMALTFGTIAGCSSTEDIADNSSDGNGQVKISLLGIGEEPEESLTKAQTEPETVTLPVEDDFGLVCTLAADQAPNTRGTTAMALGNKYRMVAYSGSTVAGSQVFAAGDENTTDPISLLPGNYTFVFYSFNNSTAPGLPDASGNVAVPAGTDLLWYSTTDTVTAGSIIPVAVTFVHRFSSVKVVANSWGVGPDISAVSASLNNAYVVNLMATDGTFSVGADSTAGVSWSDTTSKLRTSNTTAIYANGATSFTVTFPANSVTIGGVTSGSSKSVTFTKTLAAGTRYILTVRFIKCGAYTASGTYKGFMCHNLGADYTADPFTPGYKLNGAYWQWGKKNYSVGAPTSTGGAEPSYVWNSTNYNTSSAAWNSGTEAAPVKNNNNDPCPSGYRMPTSSEWNGVIDNNTGGKVYSTWVADAGNFNSAQTFGSSAGAVTLQLPIVGLRSYANGSLANRGAIGNYWSSSVNTDINPYFLYSNSSNLFVTNLSTSIRGMGFSVRCIAE